MATSSFEDLTSCQARLKKATGRLKSTLDTEFTKNPFRDIKMRIVVATTGARVGSHVMCQGLLQHGANVREFLHVNKIIKVCRKTNVTSLQEYCDDIVGRHSRNGVFGVKGEINILAPLILAGEMPQYIREWNFVFLKRTNVVRQAVSQLKAELSGSWRSTQNPSRELDSDDYDGERIVALASLYLTTAALWEDTFELFGITPFRITYEDMATDPTAWVERAAGFLGLEGAPIVDARPPVEVQADALNDCWEARFRVEKAAFCARHRL